jgi:signal transduction histidine kinase/ActR/RegA family two-component response regulator
MRLRSHLVGLVLAVLLPMIAFSAIAIVMLGHSQRAAAERSALELSRALMNAVDESLRNTITTLAALATVQSLEEDDLRAFHREARRVVMTQTDWMEVILLAPDGRQLLATGQPWGAPLPFAAEPASVETVVASRRPVVSSIARGRLTGAYAIPVRVPIIHGDRVVYVLTAIMKPEAIVNVLARQRMPDDWVGTVFDRQKNIVARTRNLEQFLGRPVSPDLSALLDTPAKHWKVTRTLEGSAVYSAWARSSETEWGVGLGIPEAVVEAPLRRSLIALGAGGVGCIVLALALAGLMGRRITEPIAALAAAAKTFGQRGTLVTQDATRVQEVEDVRRAFEDAAVLVQRRAAEADEANRAKDEFLAVLSHELRTPLNAVYGWARMLQSGAVSQDRVARALDVIVRQSNVQVQLIDDLLDVSRMITGKMRLDVRSVDLKGVVEQALDAARPAADAKEIRIQPVLDPRAGPVSGDPDRLQQVVWNLVLNAVKFTPKGGRVQVRLQRIDSYVEIIVSDTGQGIAPAVLPFIFDRFRQADSSSRRAHTGLGLGLALVKHLVELHGGSVGAQSDGEGLGATFVVKLPVALADTTADQVARAQAVTRSDGRGPRTVLHGLRVLVVDDDPEALELATAILSGAGAMVRVSASAGDALAIVRAWRPDVLVSDIEMPSEDGYSLIRNVRALGPSEGGDTPAVALTAYGRTHDRVMSLTAGYNMHVPKPVDPGELTAIIASVASGRARPGIP